MASPPAEISADDTTERLLFFLAVVAATTTLLFSIPPKRLAWLMERICKVHTRLDIPRSSRSVTTIKVFMIFGVDSSCATDYALIDIKWNETITPSRRGNRPMKRSLSFSEREEKRYR